MVAVTKGHDVNRATKTKQIHAVSGVKEFRSGNEESRSRSWKKNGINVLE
jgi:hypothetical protein